MGRQVREALHLAGTRHGTGLDVAEDAGRIDYARLRPQDLWALRARDRRGPLAGASRARAQARRLPHPPPRPGAPPAGRGRGRRGGRDVGPDEGPATQHEPGTSPARTDRSRSSSTVTVRTVIARSLSRSGETRPLSAPNDMRSAPPAGRWPSEAGRSGRVACLPGRAGPTATPAGPRRTIRTRCPDLTPTGRSPSDPARRPAGGPIGGASRTWAVVDVCDARGSPSSQVLVLGTTIWTGGACRPVRRPAGIDLPERRSWSYRLDAPARVRRRSVRIPARRASEGPSAVRPSAHARGLGDRRTLAGAVGLVSDRRTLAGALGWYRTDGPSLARFDVALFSVAEIPEI